MSNPVSGATAAASGHGPHFQQRDTEGCEPPGILFAYFKIVPFRMHSEHKRTLFLIGFVCANISHFVLGYAEFIFKRLREITA